MCVYVGESVSECESLFVSYENWWKIMHLCVYEYKPTCMTSSSTNYFLSHHFILVTTLPRNTRRCNHGMRGLGHFCTAFIVCSSRAFGPRRGGWILGQWSRQSLFTTRWDILHSLIFLSISKIIWMLMLGGKKKGKKWREREREIFNIDAWTLFILHIFNIQHFLLSWTS